jgi:eukaryotic-like serine/threonine-protein kinase
MPDSALNVVGRRYQLIDELGSGGMGSVFRAVDRLTGQWVALKRVITHADQNLANSDEYGVDLRLALAQEFRLLASLRHPHVIGVLDYGFDDDHMPYYTMDLLEDAQTILEAGQDQPFDFQVNLLVQFLQALAYMHRRGIIHRDLKPKNVLVTQGQLKVLDFGLSITVGQNPDTENTTVGTMAYMAPEILMGASASELSDLYAVGVIAYELFAGHHPFDAENVTALIRNVLNTPPDLTSANIPQPVAMLLQQLLAKNLEDRLQTAGEVIAALGQALNRPLSLETAATRESFLQAARLVGREREINQLANALSDAIDGHGSSWLVGGESGIGKSRLLSEIGTLAMVQGALVLRGDAVDQVGSPYQMWRPALRWLCLLTPPNDAELAALEQSIPDLSTLLQREIAPAPQVETRKAQAKLQRVAEAMLRRPQQPIVIILEDLQWAGSESIALLEHLNTIVAKLPILIIGSYRDDERPDLPSSLPEMHNLRLSRLTQSDIAELSEAMLGSSGRTEHIVDMLRRETEGNVYFLIEIVRALAEEAGQLDSIGVMTLPQTIFAGGMRRIIQRRLNTVLPEDRAVLNVAAIAGRQLDLHLLQTIAPTTDLDAWLTNCTNAAVLEVQDGQWRFAHDKLRNGILVSLSDEERQSLHATVANAIESVYPGSLQHNAALAYHWREANNPRKEVRYAILAGEQALLSGANQEALDLLERALTLANTYAVDQLLPTPDTIQLKRKVAQAQLALGRYAQARVTYEEALALSSQIVDWLNTAEILISLGDIDYALEQFYEAEERYQNSMSIFESINNLEGVVKALNSLGNVAYDLDDYTRANQLYQQSLALSREIGNQWGMAGSFGGSDASSEDAQADS